MATPPLGDKISSDLIEKAFKELIDTKHLYQAVNIDLEWALRQQSPIRPRAGLSERQLRGALEEVLRESIDDLATREWFFVNHPLDIGAIIFTLPPVRSLCDECGDIEPFNFWHAPQYDHTISCYSDVQVFCLPLECQRCRHNRIVFLIERRGAKIQLVGRSRIEKPKPPEYIPSTVREYYSRATIAFQSHEVLAAIFLLRTLIEQHMRATVKKPELRGDDLCDEYAKTLDDDFKRNFPSLKAIYAKLSDAMHRADADEELYESQLRDMCLHFEALNLYARTSPHK